MIRQRLRLRRLGGPELLGRLLVTVLGTALIFYGAMVVLAALKVSPATLNQLSGYRTIDHALSHITATSITGRDRIIVAAAGLGCLAVFGPLAWGALPRPYLARTRMLLDATSTRGSTEIGPRALERAAELAARRDPQVTDARARAARGQLGLDITLHDVDGPLLGRLDQVRERVRASLDEHGMPLVAIDVTLTAATLKPPADKEPS